ncbi:hypothetical protein ACN38_g3468 [Penicillium nordicum]|uniref:Uncharacterized protein n=1 Tax=Penicillium nordicum TaxID=229535 RepID=A0A0M9WHZ7_9EURO|nr:hypothetical protein ACN38_g3468 [Penicillium nordicum]
MRHSECNFGACSNIGGLFLNSDLIFSPTASESFSVVYISGAPSQTGKHKQSLRNPVISPSHMTRSAALIVIALLSLSPPHIMLTPLHLRTLQAPPSYI